MRCAATLRIRRMLLQVFVSLQLGGLGWTGASAGVEWTQGVRPQGHLCGGKKLVLFPTNRIFEGGGGGVWRLNKRNDAKPKIATIKQHCCNPRTAFSKALINASRAAKNVQVGWWGYNS